MLAAVRSEVEAERRGDGDGGDKVSLFSGRIVDRTAEHTRYVFGCRRWKPSLDGVPTLIRGSRDRGPWSPAEVSRAPDGTVRVVVPGGGIGAVTHAQLRRDESETWAVMARHLESVGTQDSTVRLEPAGWLVGQQRPRVARDADPGRCVAGSRSVTPRNSV